MRKGMQRKLYQLKLDVRRFDNICNVLIFSVIFSIITKYLINSLDHLEPHKTIVSISIILYFKYSRFATQNFELAHFNSQYCSHDSFLVGPRQTNFTVNGLNGTRIEITEDKKFELKCESHSEPPATYNIQRRPAVTKLNSDSSVGIYVIEQLKRKQEGTYVCISRNPILGNLQELEVQVVVAGSLQR